MFSPQKVWSRLLDLILDEKLKHCQNYFSNRAFLCVLLNESGMHLTFGNHFFRVKHCMLRPRQSIFQYFLAQHVWYWTYFIFRRVLENTTSRAQYTMLSPRKSIFQYPTEDEIFKYVIHRVLENTQWIMNASLYKNDCYYPLADKSIGKYHEG